jgi:hypothetical protein
MSRNRVILAHDLPMAAERLGEVTRSVADSDWYFPSDTAALAEELAARRPFLVTRVAEGIRVELSGGASFTGATLDEALTRALGLGAGAAPERTSQASGRRG